MKRKNGEMKIVAATALLTGGLTGCSGLLETSQLNRGTVEGYDRITFETAAGIRADADRQIGLMRTAKENARQDPAYFAFRDKQEPEITKRVDIKAKAPRRGWSLFGRAEDK